MNEAEEEGCPSQEEVEEHERHCTAGDEHRMEAEGEGGESDDDAAGEAGEVGKRRTVRTAADDDDDEDGSSSWELHDVVAVRWPRCAKRYQAP